MTDKDGPSSSTGDEYTDRLSKVQRKWWKSLLPVQAAYAWNLRRLDLGFVLDVGCGVGRNLRNLRGNGIGVDVNETSVQVCREQGFEAYTATELSSDPPDRQFDSMLVAHVLEHMERDSAVGLLREYLRFMPTGGVVVLICPQERGFGSDETHVEFFDIEGMVGIAEEAGLSIERSYSFPFPRFFGKLFVYNESVVVGRLVA